MRKLLLFLLVLSIAGLGGCRTRKTGCPTPKQNWGAEKVIEKMSAPKKKWWQRG